MTTHYQKIHHTTDFDKFRFITENRDIRQKHVEKLIESVKRDNRLHLHPIIVKEIDGYLYIDDGQHRFEACKNLNIPIYYIINENPTQHSMIDDQISLKWELEDRFKYYCELKYPEYLKLKQLITEYDMPFRAIFYALGRSKYSLSSMFREGKLKISPKVEDFIKKTYDFRQKVIKTWTITSAKSLLYRRDFIQALYWFSVTYPDHLKKMLVKLHDDFSSIPEKSSTDSYKKYFVTKYNYNLDKKNKLPFTDISTE